MKKIAKIAAALTLSAVLFSSFATAVSADTVKQEQELKLNCTAGSYGQSSSCTAEGKQSQTVEINGIKYFVRNDGTRVRIHTPANTSVDSVALAGIIATAVTTAGIGFVSFKKRQ
jgi:hypothetical protein